MSEPNGVVLAKGLHRPSAFRGAKTVAEPKSIGTAGRDDDYPSISMILRQLGGSLTCALGETGAVCTCLAPLTAGFRPILCHGDLKTVDIVGHISAVAERACCMAVSWVSMTRYRNSWQLTETAGAWKAMLGAV
jgi:hypothetical protein